MTSDEINAEIAAYRAEQTVPPGTTMIVKEMSGRASAPPVAARMP
jgi:hypothetical protein